MFTSKSCWIQSFAIWDYNNCQIIWQYNIMKKYRKEMLQRYYKYCNIQNCSFIKITDIEQENMLLNY